MYGYGYISIGGIGSGDSFDPDAQSFITAAGITDPTQQTAINTLVVSLKANGLWTKMKAIYPFVGGTATSHKYNLKDPRDLDVAFRLIFNGGWTHSATGALPNGTNGFANTKFNNSLLSQNNNAIGFYSRTNVILAQTDIGIQTPPEINMGANFVGAGAFSRNFNSAFGGFVNLNTQGFYTNTRTISTENRMYKNGTLLGVVPSISGIPVSGTNIAISGEMNSGNLSVSFPSSKQFAFSFISDGLNSTENANFYTAVQTFQTTLGRSIGTQTVSDADAQAFVTNAGIVDQVEANAINTLVVSLKANGLWTKIKAIYPFVGGTATSHKYNLKNPLDTDAAFRLVFSGGITHSANGVQGNGLNGYYMTYINPSTEFSPTSGGSQFVYIRNNTDTGSDLGAFQTVVNYRFQLAAKFGNTFYGACLSNGVYSQSNTDSRGFFGITRPPSSASYFSILNTNSFSTTDAYQEPNSIITGLAQNNTNIIQSFSDHQHSMSCIADGLTTNEAQNLRVINLAFQTTLNRQV
jgi:hypothetical protein